MSVRPIKPHEIASKRSITPPDFVYEVWNELISRHYHNGVSRVLQQDAVSALLRATDGDPTGITRDDIYNNGWLNIEEAYREAGWFVTYDKPGICESYGATFIFRRNSG